MKRLVTTIALGVSLLISSPAFAYTIDMSNDNSRYVEPVEVPKPITKPIAPPKVVTKEVVVYPGLDEHDRNLLARLVQAEAGIEPFLGKIAVIHVIFNRIADGRFPKTIEGVIYQPNQFETVSNGSINNIPTLEDYHAVDEAYQNRTNDDGSVFFYDPATATNHWLDSHPVVKRIGHHVFTK